MSDFEKWLSALVFFSAFRVLIHRLYAGHEPVVWSVEWKAEPLYARQDRVMKVHNGTRKALDPQTTICGFLQLSSLLGSKPKTLLK